MPIIRFDRVSKTFHKHSGPRLLREHLESFFKTTKTDVNEFYALKDVSFQISRGESVAFVGRNGAGKSTTLALIAGLAYPNFGDVAVKGRVAALMELGSGFHPDLTGAENIRLNASLLGLTAGEFRRLYNSIIDFSGLDEEFISKPIRTYSSGMVVRLAFSVAVNMEPDILIVDEVLAVGDQAFQLKCQDRVRLFRESGRTLVCVSHSAPTVEQLCDRAIWLDQGELMMDGSSKAVLNAYHGQTVPSSS